MYSKPIVAKSLGQTLDSSSIYDEVCCSKGGAQAAIMQAFSMRHFNFISISIAISMYVLENLSSFNENSQIKAILSIYSS